MKQNDMTALGEVERIGKDILDSDRFGRAQQICHHKKENVAQHSLRVASQGYRMAKWLDRHGIDVNTEDVVRGGLLHDIGLTEEAVSSSPSYRKAYRHPREGEAIAR